MALKGLSFLTDHLKQGLNVSKAISECLLTTSVAINFGNMVRHQHAVILDFFVGANHFQEIHIAVVRKRFAKV